jgi:hypothetical protein
MGLVKTIQLTVVIDDEANPMAERIVTGAIKGVMPSIRRQAYSAEYEIYDGGAYAPKDEGEIAR